MTLLMTGAPVAKTILEEVAQKVQDERVQPGLVVVQVGNDEASSVYVGRKKARADNLGFLSRSILLSENITEQALLDCISNLNEDASVHGILVQLPLPKHIHELTVLQHVAPQKDVDGFHPINAGHLFQGAPKFIPCTPMGIMKMLQFYNIPLLGKHAVVIGRSNIVGRPMASLLEQANCTVTLCHSKTQNLSEILKMADIVVVAVGQANFVHGKDLKEGVVVIDVGINRLESGMLCGDVHFESAQSKALAITPVPKGVGPMTIACLMANTLQAALQK